MCGQNIIKIAVTNANRKLYIQSEQHKLLKRDQEVRLTNIEFRILYVLVLHQGSILSKEQIYNFVWNGEYLRDDSNITSHIRRLRKKIEDDPSRPEYIQTVRGVGYRMNTVKRNSLCLSTIGFIIVLC